MSEVIKLYTSQVEHSERLKIILRAHPLALDLSMLGSGKTYTASHIAMDDSFKFERVIVIAPVSVQPKWDDMKRKFGVPITQNVSFSQLRSLKCKQPKHGLLMRRDYTNEMHLHGHTVMIDKVEFTTTAQYRKYVDEGVLLIVDEIQSIKNVSSQFLACRTLIREIIARGTSPSKVLLLSGSPLDRREQVVSLFRTMHVMKCDELAAFNIGQRILEWRGMQDIEAHCVTLNSEEVARVRARHSRSGQVANGRLEAYCYDLFQSVFKQARSSEMPVRSLGSHVSKLNAFFEVHDTRDRMALSCGVTALTKACAFNTSTMQVDYLHNGTTALESLRMITRSLLQIETGKIGVFIGTTSIILDSTPNTKVVICVNYSATLRDLVAGLSRYNPLVLDGSTPVHKRMELLGKFQAADCAHRLLIGNVSVMSTGIDLDDKSGMFPRIALINPSYSTIALYQLGHRFLRADTKSDSNVLFVFGKHSTELHMLEALARKSCVMKQTTREQSVAGVVFPGDYTKVDGDKHIEDLCCQQSMRHDERVLIGVTEQVTKDEETSAELVVQAEEAGVTHSNELNPFAFDGEGLLVAFAPELQALELSSVGDVHV